MFFSIVSLQYVVIPTRRSAAEAVQILISHLLGDAGSPYLIGQVRNITISGILICIMKTLKTLILSLKGQISTC